MLLSEHLSMCSHLIEGGFQHPLYLCRSAIYRFVNGIGMMDCSDRLMSCDSGFYRTALVIGSELVAVLIAKVNFKSRHFVFKAFQGFCHYGRKISCHSFPAFNMVVCVELDMHDLFLLNLLQNGRI